MTSSPPGSDLDTIVSRTRHLLLDFDGPICSIYAGLPAVTVADRLRKLFGDHAQLPDDIAHTADPLEVFAYAATVSEPLNELGECRARAARSDGDSRRRWGGSLARFL